jgi:hypothetical protein
MTTPGRVGAGAALGVLAASLAFPALGFFRRPGEWGIGPLFYLGAMPLVILFMAVLAGPGAFLLSWIHAVKMEDWAPKARSVGHLRNVGVLLGLPLGVANLLLVFIVLRFLGARNHESILALAPWLIPALAGGAGLGWGVTLGLTPGRAAPARTTARPRPARKLRRDGPPFFDNRATGNIRRTA